MSIFSRFARRPSGRTVVGLALASSVAFSAVVSIGAASAAVKTVERLLTEINAAETERRTKTVLVVDDDPDARRIATTILASEGYGVLEAESAERALDTIRSRRVDLVILDLALPGTPGLELLATLRRHHDVPVLIISGNDDVNTRIVGLRVGADDFVVKPVAPGEISARVGALLRRTEPMRLVGTLEFDDILIDRDARQVFIRGRRVELAPKEFDLLQFLASSPRRAYSRQTLLEKVWQSSAEWQQQATVTEHIRKLRTKIEDNPAAPRWICTVRNMGYRFDP
ncbi:MAG: response regulator transcription factor [Acidimicrobiales bacterium]